MDVRIISATNKDLKEAIAQGQFREDLFYRLNVLPLALPALRERPQDIPDLLEYFIKRDCLRLGLASKRVSPAALVRLTVQPWRGNIREMENLVKYLLTVVEGPVIDRPTRRYLLKARLIHIARQILAYPALQRQLLTLLQQRNGRLSE